MSEVSESIVFHRSIAKDSTDTIKKKIPWNSYITRIQYFFAKNQQNLLQVDVKVKGVSVAKYEKDSNEYVAGDGVVVDILTFFEVSAEEELQCWYKNTDTVDTKTLFVVVHLVRKLAPEEELPREARFWWM